jgi:hypothetical protein
MKAEEILTRMHEQLHDTTNEPVKRAPGRLPKVAASLEQAVWAVEAAGHEHRRLAGQRATVTQSLSAIGHAYHFVDLERGVRRHGQLIAGDIQRHIDTVRTITQQEHLSETCMDRIEKAARVIPKMQATIEFVSGYVRRQVKQVLPPGVVSVSF